jgi:glycosyltransferase involved in cell wall biosynthesis
MRIGIDVRELTGRPTGVGTYLGHLLAGWGDMRSRGEGAPHEWVLYAPSPIVDGYRATVDALGAVEHQVPGGAGTRWEQFALMKAANRDRLDVLFAPAYTAPLGVRCPLVLTIHDVAFLAHPEWFRPRERLRRAWLTRRAASRARLVLTDSEFSRREILRVTHLGPDRLRVILLGRPRSVFGQDAPRGLREPLVLFVGSIFNRRRVPDLIRAFALVSSRHPGARLAVVGENRTWPWQDIAAACRTAGVESRVALCDYVDDRRLADLYGRASCFVFLSEYEGFGLTPLEAMAHGVPPVLLDTEVARETCGPGALYVRHGDISGTAAAIEALLTEERPRRALLDAAEAVLGRYSWARASRETLAAIEDAAS